MKREPRIAPWPLLSLVNLLFVALLGFVLRSKILYALPGNYRFLLNAHTHFAFSGWVTLALLALFTQRFIPQAASAWYHRVLWAIELSAVGMLCTLPFQGHGPLALVCSTFFLLCTWLYAFLFFRRLPPFWIKEPTQVLAAGALASLVLSTGGPLILAWMQAGGSADSILHRDALYYYLHFQYNGFFTLGVFALLLGQGLSTPHPKPALRFAWLLAASVLPSYALSLLWHPYHAGIWSLAVVGMMLILLSLWYFLRLWRPLLSAVTKAPLPARILWILVLLSFAVKMLLQTGTIFPQLANAVFGFRPVIIGFLHLVFLGLVSFYILGAYVHDGILPAHKRLTVWALAVFAAGVVAQELILAVQGVGLLLGSYSPVFNHLLWYAALLLLAGSVLLLVAAATHSRQTPTKKPPLGAADSLVA